MHERPRASRPYDSRLRRERAAQTRESIITAGADLVRNLSSWDWRTLTVRAVAVRAGVHERTVYRHFPTEQDLRDAIVHRLEQESGVRVDGIGLGDVDTYVTQLFRFLSTLSTSNDRPQDPSLAAIDQRRKDAILAAVRRGAVDWSDADRRLAAALIDVLWGVPSYRRLVSGWELDPAEATRGVSWLIGLVVAAVRDDRPPAPPEDGR
jgi:AcrR family transcriptional regulator